VRGNPHAMFDEAGAGNVVWLRCCDTRRRKGGEAAGNTNLDLPPTRQSSTLPARGRCCNSIGLPHPATSLNFQITLEHRRRNSRGSSDNLQPTQLHATH
jgi:hypothetical protein